MNKQHQIKVYAYKNCSTCQKALKFLDQNNISYELLAIREQPPTVAELKLMLQVQKDLKKLFNTSGLEYKALNMKEQVKSLSEEQALKLLSQNGKLVKRPFLISSEGLALVGFKTEEWSKVLS